ncbi:MAG TPA: hypothetical protein VN922_14490 [Bacteroidia bacterium]|nr:hypothetical protein [Bacteroidia bacterium]
MKKLLFLFLLFSTRVSMAQKPDTISHGCPIGYVWLDPISSSSLIIPGNECVTKKQYEVTMKMFWHNVCDETRFLMMGTGSDKREYAFSVIHIWNDKTGCNEKYKYEVRVSKHKWIEITKREYDKYNHGLTLSTDTVK